MKKILFLFVFILFGVWALADNWITIDNTQSQKTSVKLLNSTEEISVIQFNVNAYKLDEVLTQKGTSNIVKIPDGIPIEEKGAPDLPKLSTSLIIPNNKQMKLEVQYSDFIEIPNVEIAPSKGVLTRDIDPATVPYTYGKQYQQNTFYPNDIAKLNDPYIVRNYRGAAVWVYPVQYNPVTKVLRIYKSITVKVSPTGNTAIINPLLQEKGGHTFTPEFNEIYKRNFINYNTYQTKYTPIDEGTPGRMLIISYGSYMTAMQDFVNWKNQKGIYTEIVDVSTIGSTASAIKTYVQNYYNSHSDFCYLLLVGDYNYVPVSSTSAGDSDNNYGYLAGSDHRIDIFVGRFSAESTTHVTTQVDRTIHYERDITSSENWMQYGLCVASYEGPGDDNEYDYEHEDNIKADYLAYGYISVATCYQNLSQTATDITNAINSHCGVISYTGHGDTQMWYSVNPSGYTNTHVNALTNNNMLPFIFSVACVIGDFAGNTCFSEAWQRATNNGEPTGAIANIGSTINQSWNSPMDAQDEMVDILVESYSNNIKRTFGGIVANGWGLMIDDYGTDGNNMADTWTVFGDASVMVRTKQPQNMTISHASSVSSGATSFNVNCDVDGALVSITKDNVILGTGYVSGGSVNVSLNPSVSGSGSILVTVTAYNKVTYQQYVPIASAGDPLGLTATAVNYDQIDLSWVQNTNNDPVLVAWSPTGTFGTPVDGTIYSPGNSIPGGGTVLYYGSNLTYNHTGLTEQTTYYYKAWSYLPSNTYSPGITANATTPTAPVHNYPFTWDFESCTDYDVSASFAPWTVYDGDASTTYQSSDCDFTNEGTAFAFMAFNTSDCWQAAQGDAAHSGVRVGMAVCPSDASQSDDWFISPQLQLGTGSSFSLWVLSPKPGTWGNDTYEIMVSTTDNQPSSFTAISPVETAPDVWTQKSYDLSAYDNQTIYIAIHHPTTDMFMLWIDDLQINSTMSSCGTPTFVSQPSNATECVGSNVTFNVSTNATPPVIYQWQLNGTNITGANSNSYTINNITINDAGNYTCLVTDSCGTQITSNAAVLTVNTTPVISSQPASSSVCEGNNLTLNVTASGSGLSYQWQLNGNNISGANNSSYTITSASASDAGNYTCIVTNSCGSVTSNTANVTVNPATVVTTQPNDITAYVGDNISFIVAATGNNLTYQWKKDGNNLNNGGNISGVTTNTLTINPVSSADYGYYTCQVTGDCGSDESNSALLTVLVSVTELNNAGVSIYPNPSTGKFAIDFGNEANDVTVIVRDINSKEVYKANYSTLSKTEIDLTGFSKGTYYVEINAGGKIIHAKVLIQ